MTVRPGPRAKAKNRPRRRDRIAAYLGDPVLRRYQDCVAKGQPAQTGVPDGDGRPSIVVNRRFRHVLTPDIDSQNGNRIKFILGVSPTGVITQYRFVNEYTYEAAVLDAAKASGMTLQSVNTTTHPKVTPQVSDQISIAGVNSEVMAGSPGVSWRLVNAVHQLHFTGSTQADGGSVKITPINISLRSSSIRTSTASNRSALAYTPIPVNPPLLAESYVGAARDPISIVQVPRSTEYAELTPCYAPSGIGSGLSPVGPSGTTRVWWAPHPDLRFYMVDYDGVADNASVTVDSRVCVQIIRQSYSSLESAVAKPSESAAPSLQQSVLGKLSNLAIVHGLDVAKHVFDALR